ncbi:MAG: hypothetical protein ACTTHG_01310 [Treponemataceae bacterium]
MKKLAIFFVILFLSVSIFSQSLALSGLKEEELSWRLLEKAESAYDERNFSRSAKLVQIAKINRNLESKLYIEILEQALKPLPVQKVGNNIDNVLEILAERDAKDAIKIIKDTVKIHGQEYFEYDVQNILKYYKRYGIYPEADFLQAKIFRLEGESELAEKYYLTAFENSSQLDIPMVKYDILYELASLYKIKKNFEDYEKTLLLIVSDDNNFYLNGEVSPFLQSVLKNIKIGMSLDKLFLLYRSDSYNQINAYFQLAELYESKKMYEKMLEATSIGMLASVTRIEEILNERELEYTYKNFGNFYSLAEKYSDIIEWGIENQIWKGFYDFAYSLELNMVNNLAKEMYVANIIYSPEVYWVKKSKEKLKKMNSN